MNAALYAAADSPPRGLFSIADEEREEPSDEQALLSGATSPARQEAWSALLDRTLLEWGCQAERGELEPTDDDIPPGPNVIAEAYGFAKFLGDRRLPPPARISMDGDGGVVFRFLVETAETALHLCDDGSIEVNLYENGLFTFGRTFHADA